LRFKKTIVFSFIILVIFLIYSFFHDGRIHYVALGDSLASGQNPYGEKVGYGYTDYIRDYLDDQNQLKQYVKEYATSGYTTSDILEDLSNNKRIMVDDREVNIRNVLRESDLVTISIGANDFMHDLNLSNLDFSDPSVYYQKIDSIMENVSKLLREVRKYAKNKVVVIGYYNPFPILFKTNEKVLDAIFQYADDAYQKICTTHDVSYVSVYSTFKKHSEYLPNPFDIHPNTKGYRAISSLIIDQIFPKS